MDLFDVAATQQRQKSAPLAARMRPRTLDEYIGQDEIVGKGRLLRRAIEGDQLSSLIFYGRLEAAKLHWLKSLPIRLEEIFGPSPQSAPAFLKSGSY